MRRISHDLLPNTLERKGLLEAIREFINQVSGKHSLNIQLYIVKEINVPKDKEIHIFRMIQEIVHNTLKHAQAHNLQIGFSEENGNMLCLIKDDGRGFDKEKVLASSQGLGLRSLESRCEILNGILSLDSMPGAGTNYFIKIPVG
jgi:signal transduction histidine kinase